MNPQDNVRSAESEPTDPKRVRAFAEFFKRYMSISTLVIAALPIPVTSLNLIPTFTAQTKILSVYTSLFCFLILGLIFYLRHQLARILFHEFFSNEDYWVTPLDRADPNVRWRRNVRKFLKASLIGLIPLLLIAASVFSAFQYNDNLVGNVSKIKQSIWDRAGIEQRLATEADVKAVKERTTFDAILKNTELDQIPRGSLLMLLYILIFITAEAAFVLMAIKEYLQDLVKLTEVDLIQGRKLVAVSDAAPSEANVTVTEKTIEAQALADEDIQKRKTF